MRKAIRLFRNRASKQSIHHFRLHVTAQLEACSTASVQVFSNPQFSGLGTADAGECLGSWNLVALWYESLDIYEVVALR